MRGELPKRKSTRLHGYNYDESRAYFITLCTEGKKCILSRIDPLDCQMQLSHEAVGEGSPLPLHARYVANHTVLGNLLDTYICRISTQYPTVSVDSYVIMPNHVHLLLAIANQSPEDGGRGDPSPTIPSVVGWLKYHATVEINRVWDTTGKRVFQRSFYDHIIRSPQDYNDHLRYIHENPLRWHYDELYTEK